MTAGIQVRAARLHKVAIAENGPYLVSASVPLSVQVIAPNAQESSWGRVQGRSCQAETSYALYRCGFSDTKPFCDGSRAAIKFNDGLVEE